MKKTKTLEDLAHEALRRPHRKFIKDTGGKESEFTNGYSWGFVAGFKLAAKRRGKGKP
jgi:hypothetical protein